MNNPYFQNQLQILEKMTDKSAEKQLTFFQSLLIVSVTLLGILISLHNSTTDSLILRLVFAVALFLLSLGILSTAVVVYDWSMIVEKARQKFSREVQNALREDRRVNPVFEKNSKIAVVCTKTAYTSLSIALLLLTIYAIMSLFS